MYYFTPRGLLITRSQYEALLAGDATPLRSEIIEMTNRQLCDLAWRAGLDWDNPLKFARGEIKLTPKQGRWLWRAYMNPGFCFHGYDDNGNPIRPPEPGPIRSHHRKFGVKPKPYTGLPRYLEFRNLLRDGCFTVVSDPRARFKPFHPAWIRRRNMKKSWQLI